MRTLKLFLIISAIGFEIFILNSCETEKMKKENSDNNLISKELNNQLFNKVNCNCDDYKSLIECGSPFVEQYQIELRFAFADAKTISLILEHGKLKELSYIHFIDYSSKQSEGSVVGMKNCEFFASNKIGDSLFATYTISKIPVLFPTPQIDSFFTKILWKMPSVKYQSDILDPQIWTIKGRKYGIYREWERYAFMDNKENFMFFMNIQAVLDLCEIEDYNYAKYLEWEQKKSD